jgi:small subunit ribosomal protein S24e
MRLALVFRNRRRLLMKVDSVQGAVSSIPNPRKRPFAQQATAPTSSQLPLSSKLPRVDSSMPSSSFSASRRPATIPDPPTLVSPPFEMPHASQQPASRSSRGFGLRSQSVGHGSSHRLSAKNRGGRSVARKLLDAPLHDQTYITEEHRNIFLPLKPMHEEAPKSSLGNFSMLATGKLPSYKAVEGAFMGDPHGHTIQMWRQVSLSILSHA